MKHEDFAIEITCNINDLPGINVGNTYIVMAVNRSTGTVKLNRYSDIEWADFNKLLTVEAFIKAPNES